MTDSHMRILRLAALRAQRALDDHDAMDHAGDARSLGRRQELVQIAASNRARVSEACARRRY
jgi:hypothetical protein